MDLVSLADVKLRLNIDTEQEENDSLLAYLITIASGEVEDFLNRAVEIDDFTEYFDVVGKNEQYSLKAYPVTALTNVWNDPDWDYDSGTAISTDYIKTNDATGILYVSKYVLLDGFQALKVSYSGGMAATAAAFKTAYPTLYDACVRHVCYLKQTAKHIGATNVTSHSGNVSFARQEQFLPDVKKILSKHQRRLL